MAADSPFQIGDRVRINCPDMAGDGQLATVVAVLPATEPWPISVTPDKPVKNLATLIFDASELVLVERAS